MSALDNFVNRYANQQLTDNAGNYKGECLSLVKRYAQEVQGVPNADAVLRAINGAAKDLWLSPQTPELQYYDKVDSPQPGDIAVYTNGTYGDVAIYLGNGQVFGQLGTPVFKPAAVRNVGNPAGFLRLKGDNEDMIQDQGQADRVYASTLHTVDPDSAHSIIGVEYDSALASVQGTPKWKEQDKVLNQYMPDAMATLGVSDPAQVSAAIKKLQAGAIKLSANTLYTT